jgi:hypothetical protein
MGPGHKLVGALLAAAAFALAHPWVPDAKAEYKGLKRIPYADAFCESGGDPYNRRSRTYRGKWQFDQWTWDRFAPRWLRHQDPATVPEFWQDLVAVRVTYDAWPNC